jgi:hypothetical protein
MHADASASGGMDGSHTGNGSGSGGKPTSSTGMPRPGNTMTDAGGLDARATKPASNSTDASQSPAVDGWSKATGCVHDDDGMLCKTSYRAEKRIDAAEFSFGSALSSAWVYSLLQEQGVVRALN